MVEATIKQQVANLKMRRVPEGIEVTVQTSAAVEAMFASIAGGRPTATIPRRPGGESLSSYYSATFGFSDAPLAKAILAQGSSAPGGLVIIVGAARTREQMDRTAGEFRENVARLYEEHLRPYEVSVNITARTGPAADIA